MSQRIALGFGNNIDYEIAWNTEVFEDLISFYKICNHELNTHRAIRSERDLVISILAFVKGSCGGERYVSSSRLIEEFSSRFEKKITLGGTPVRAAIAMGKLGYTAALHLVTKNDQVRSQLPADCKYVCSNTHDSSYPHLIVQFSHDTHVCAGDIDIRASQSNRLIYHCNSDNIAMKLNVEFAERLEDAKVLLISGFNAMQSRQLLEDRLKTLDHMMQSLPDGAIVFYEDGGYFDPGFRRTIHQTLRRKIDVYSLNEDELQANLGRKLDLQDVTQVRTALADLKELIPVDTLVLHTRNWALAYGAGASKYAAALKAGITMATTRFRNGDDFTLTNYRRIHGMAPRPKNAKFADTIGASARNDTCCMPVAAVEQSNATTIGLGDAFVGGFLPALLH